MMENDLFHKLFILLFLIGELIRAYYTGIASATGESVSRRDEGKLVFVSRFIVAIPVLIVCILYILNPSWVLFFSIEIYTPLRWIGTLMLAIGIFFYWYTHYHLGKSFTDTVFIRREAELIVSGPYRWVRHPMYTSGLLITIGAGLMMENWFVGIFGTFFVSLVMYMRTPIEEDKLISRFGDAYMQYMKNTPRYFPGF